MPRAVEIRAVVTVAALALGAAVVATTLTARSDAAAAKTVNVRGFAYRPATLTVAKGTRVTFANRDAVAHTVTDRGKFDSGRIGARRSFSIRFRQKGSFSYHCNNSNNNNKCLKSK